jgi:putative transcriptional regulator
LVLARGARRDHSGGMTLDCTALAGKLLIAMPDMADPRFARSVIYLCAHSSDGGMGLIINKPQEQIRFGDLLDQIGVPHGPQTRDIKVHFGGPVENGRGFVLHSADYTSGAGTMRVDECFGMTATLDVLEDIAAGHGPAQSLLALGYAGWGPGQLEQEIRSNGWLVSDPSPDLIFAQSYDRTWQAALAALGVNPLVLSAVAGRA